MRLLSRIFTVTLGTATTGNTAMTEDAQTRSRGESSSKIFQKWLRAAVYVDGTLADEVEVLDEWLLVVKVGSKVVIELPLSRCAPIRPSVTSNAALTTGQTEHALPIGEGVLGGIQIPSEQGSVFVSVRPAPWAAAPAPAADTVVGVAFTYQEG